jgi:signal transduction histidine kinase
MLHEFLLANRAAIIARARSKGTARPAARAIEEELGGGIPLFLDQLTNALRLLQASTPAMEESATRHGGDLLRRGFTVAQVVHDYGGVCQAVTELADDTNVSITADEFRFFNRYLDDSIARAVTEYTRQRETLVAEGTERLAELARELRRSLGAAMLAFESVQTGRVGPRGSTAAVLGRSLMHLSGLIDSSLARLRLEGGIEVTERVSLRELLEEVEVGATMEANARDITLTVAPVGGGVDVEADRQLLSAAVANLLRNAFKRTPSRGHVSLTTSWTEDRVRIDVEDQGGGLGPSLGPDLSITGKSVESAGGDLRVREIPGVGHVFTIDLPRLVGSASPSVN